jgi:hypothetical protein
VEALVVFADVYEGHLLSYLQPSVASCLGGEVLDAAFGPGDHLCGGFGWDSDTYPTSSSSAWSL